MHELALRTITGCCAHRTDAIVQAMWPSSLSVPATLRSVAWRYRAFGPLRRHPFSPASPLPWRDSAAAGTAPALDMQARNQRIARLEAVLFLSREPLSSRKLAQLANLADGTEARTLVRQIREKHDARGSGFQVEEIAGGFQFLTRRRYAAWLRQMQSPPFGVRLSGPAMETLVVVAYCQPVLRADIEAVRGVQCGELLRQLMERDLVRIAGRSDELGRPFLYGTTKRFLQVFGLRSTDDLPRAERIRPGPPRANGGTVANAKAESHDSGSRATVESQTEEVSPVFNANGPHPFRNNESAVGQQDTDIVSQIDDEDLDDEDLEDDEEYEYEYEYEDEDEDEDEEGDEEGGDEDEDEEYEDEDDDEEGDDEADEEGDDEEEYEYEDEELEDDDEEYPEDGEEEDDEEYEDDDEWEEVEDDEEYEDEDGDEEEWDEEDDDEDEWEEVDEDR